MIQKCILFFVLVKNLFIQLYHYQQIISNANSFPSIFLKYSRQEDWWKKEHKNIGKKISIQIYSFVINNFVLNKILGGEKDGSFSYFNFFFPFLFQHTHSLSPLHQNIFTEKVRPEKGFQNFNGKNCHSLHLESKWHHRILTVMGHFYHILKLP